MATLARGGGSLMVSWALAGRNALVVGGTDDSRVLFCLEADAYVTVVANESELCQSLLTRIHRGEVIHIDRGFEPRDIDGKSIVFVTLQDSAAARNVAMAAKQRKVPVNLSTESDLSDFWLMSSFRDHELQVSVSTNGNGPSLANRIRKHISATLPQHAGRAVHNVGLLRQKLRAADDSDSKKRFAFVNRIADEWPMEALAGLTESDIEGLVEAFKRGAETVQSSSHTTGTIRIMSAGTGDVDTLTVAAHKALINADLVLADHDIPNSILSIITGQVQLLNESDIPLELTVHALPALKRGLQVVRLVAAENGHNIVHDLEFFSSHGYKAQNLVGVHPSVVPSTVAGIPLVYPGVSEQVLVTPATRRDGTFASVPAYNESRTVVVSGGKLSWDAITKLDYPATVPVAVIHVVDGAHQVLKTTLADSAILAKTDANLNIESIVIGRVVDLVNQKPVVKSRAAEHDHALTKKVQQSCGCGHEHEHEDEFHHVSMVNERQGALEVINGQSVAAEVAYKLSDMSFVYPVTPISSVADHVHHLVESSALNIKGSIPQVFDMSTRIGAGSAVHGAAAHGLAVSALLSSEALQLMVPAMHHMVAEHLPTVFHVSAQAVDTANTFKVSTSFSDVAAVTHTGFGMVSSASVQEAHDLGVITHIAAVVNKTPMLHFYDGARVATELSSAHVLSAQELALAVKHTAATSKSGHHDVPASVENIMTSLAPIFGHQYHVFEYVGHAKAESIVVAVGPAALIAETAVNALVLGGHRVGVVKVRVWRPWSDKLFAEAVPASVKRISVVDQSTVSTVCHGQLYLDVAGSLYSGNKIGSNPILLKARVETNDLHPSAIETLFKDLESSKPTFDYVIAQESLPQAESDEGYIPQQIHQAVFWDLAEAKTLPASATIVKTMHDSGFTTVQAFTAHDAVQVEPVHATHIRMGVDEVIGVHHAVRSADYVSVHTASIASSYNVAGSLKDGAIIVFNAPWSSEKDLDKELPNCVKASIGKRHAKVYAIDADKIAKSLTVFRPSDIPDFVGLILQTVYFQLVAAENAPIYLSILKHTVSATETNNNIIQTKLMAIQKAVAALTEIATPASWAKLPVDRELPVNVSGTIALEKQVLAEEDEESLIQTQVKSYHAAWAVMFAEAYGLKKDLRPDIEKSFVVRVDENRRITPDSYDRNVFHMEFDTTGTDLKYDIGEALGVHGHNDAEEVADFIKFYGLNPDDLIFIERKTEGKTELRTIDQVLTQLLDLFGKPGRKFYQSLATYATALKETEQLNILASSEGQEAFDHLTNVETVTYVDLLKRFPSAHPSITDLLTMIPYIKPRHYSIASSQHMHPNSVHLLVVLVDWKTPSGESRYGQCTRYLMNIKPNATMAVSIKPSVMKLPPAHTAPVIMAGLGTGMAPFRAFIEERAYLRSLGHSVGPMVLYFGSRSRGMEYLYGEELEAYAADGLVTLRCAFSRDQKHKIYIQHLIQEDSDLMCDLMVQKGGSFYLCGPTWPVPDVRDALVSAFSKTMPTEKAPEHLESLKEEERYILEVY
ncbi:hypothetical protein SmJEL517_g03074 [Synchytrium microbalum]|uniref:FAD-binding FR-type domain-containing protein n=1 Tax=Synchytrium microbalum TaxID=1806994 RepID=A0A507BZG3_9FUNG|nr:uncharacterized protein SmJEL517_g03074 [Synchytrium microbalum]TPX34187.1 hypothetical protein SmJEL517_g03074 [Synchytrium microbalum]